MKGTYYVIAVFMLLFLVGCGTLSLPIYLLHQPVLSGLCMLLSLLK